MKTHDNIKKNGFTMKYITLTTLLFITLLFTSCSEYSKNQRTLNKAFDLYTNAEDNKDLEEAARMYSSVINQKIYASERLAVVYRILGDRSLQSEQFGFAAKYYTEALKITPAKTSVHYGLGLAYANLYETSADANQKREFLVRAEEEIRYAVSKDAENPNYHATLATILGVYKGDTKAALDEISLALRYNPDNIEYIFLLARLEYDASDFEKSIRAYRRIIELSGDSYNTRKTAEENIAKINSMRK